jgi:hypothetical protein
MNEKRIEEAASAIHSIAESGASWTDARMADKDQHRAEARAALAVFEKARTTTAHEVTTDERETLVAAIADAMGANGEFGTSALSDVSNVVELELVDDSGQLHVYRDSGVGDGFSIDLGKIADAVITLHAYRTVHSGYSTAEDIEARVDAALSAYKGYYQDHESPGDPSRNAIRVALRAAGVS